MHLRWGWVATCAGAVLLSAGALAWYMEPRRRRIRQFVLDASSRRSHQAPPDVVVDGAAASTSTRGVGAAPTARLNALISCATNACLLDSDGILQDVQCGALDDKDVYAAVSAIVALEAATAIVCRSGSNSKGRPWGEVALQCLTIIARHRTTTSTSPSSVVPFRDITIDEARVSVLIGSLGVSNSVSALLSHDAAAARLADSTLLRFVKRGLALMISPRGAAYRRSGVDLSRADQAHITNLLTKMTGVFPRDEQEKLKALCVAPLPQCVDMMTPYEPEGLRALETPLGRTVADDQSCPPTVAAGGMVLWFEESRTALLRTILGEGIVFSAPSELAAAATAVADYSSLRCGDEPLRRFVEIIGRAPRPFKVLDDSGDTVLHKLAATVCLTATRAPRNDAAAALIRNVAVAVSRTLARAANEDAPTSCAHVPDPDVLSSEAVMVAHPLEGSKAWFRLDMSAGERQKALVSAENGRGQTPYTLVAQCSQILGGWLQPVCAAMSGSDFEYL